ncbi:MAG: hypothetical protein ACOCRX_04175 [Candidatus Woesearchaeota archaeon]
MEKEVVKVDYGVASCYGNLIEMNRKLFDKEYEILGEEILEHEKRHTSDKKYGKKDFVNDFMSKKSNFFRIIKFCRKNKEGFINFFPFMYSYYQKEWTFNLTTLFPFVYLGILFVLFFWLTLPISPLYLIYVWIGFVFWMNLVFLIITHFYVKNTQK